MQLDGQMHRFFFCRFETYPSGRLRFEPTRTTFRGRSYRHLNRLNRRSEPRWMSGLSQAILRHQGISSPFPPPTLQFLQITVTPDAPYGGEERDIRYYIF